MSEGLCQLEVIYCDDIRAEANGKRMYIGVYTSAMILPFFPAMLPKLCIFLRYLGTADPPPRLISFSVFRNDELLQEAALPEEAVKRANKALEGTAANAVRADMTFEFTPFEVREPCTLRVKANVDGKELKSATLRIVKGEVAGVAKPEASDSTKPSRKTR
jgi:hypothetical protein